MCLLGCGHRHYVLRRSELADVARRVSTKGGGNNGGGIGLAGHQIGSLGHCVADVFGIALKVEVFFTSAAVLIGRLHRAGDPVHGFGRANRVLARGGLSGEHHRIRSVENSVGYIGELGPGRLGVGYHRVEHLRCRYHRLVLHVALLNNALLRQRNVLGAQLYAEITSSDHDPPGDTNDIVNVINSLLILNLCDHANVAVVPL